MGVNDNESRWKDRGGEAKVLPGCELSNLVAHGFDKDKVMADVLGGVLEGIKPENGTFAKDGEIVFDKESNNNAVFTVEMLRDVAREQFN